jgi:hypothetical protein
MKAVYSDERRNAIGNLNKDKLLSEKTKNKMREGALLRSPRVFSDKTLSNLKKKSKAIILYNIKDRTVFGEFCSIVETAKSVFCNEKTIIRSLKTEKKVLLKR